MSVDPSEREKWDRKHRGVRGAGSPSPFLREVLPFLPSGRCLDLAAGTGTNALLLAESGRSVDAVDWSFAGLRIARDEALRRGVPLRCVVADVTALPLPASRYDVLICFRFLERSLWPAMIRALRPGGALVVETFTVERRGSRPDFPIEYCLAPGELLTAFAGARIALYREIPGAETASLLAFVPAPPARSTQKLERAG